MAHFLRDINSGEKHNLHQGKINVGRKGQDINIEDPLVSSHHLSLHVNGNQIKLEEKGSKNGTYINGEKILTMALIELSHKDQIKIGKSNFEILIEKATTTEITQNLDEDKSSLSGSYRMSEAHTSIISAASSDQLSNFAFVSDSKALFSLILKNLLLTIVTLGLYAPFAKTNIRKFLWSHSTLEGEAFHFFGTGIELFKAYLKVGALYLAVIFIAEFLIGSKPQLGFILPLFTSVFYIFLYTRAKYGAHRYLMNRTSYRNIHFFMDKKGSWTYTLEILKGAVLCLITFGLYYPYLMCKLDKIKWQNSKFGTTPFSYTAKGSEYFRVYLKGQILTLLTLGLYLPFFTANLHRMQVSHIKIATAKFESHITGFGVFKLVIINFILIAITFGIALPWVIALNARYYLENLKMVGSINFHDIEQAPKINEGAFMDQVVDFFDADAI